MSYLVFLGSFLVIHLLSGKDKSLLRRRDSFLFFNLYKFMLQLDTNENNAWGEKRKTFKKTEALDKCNFFSSYYGKAQCPARHLSKHKTAT